MGEKMTHTLRPSPTALLNPRNDATFKALFTQETPESKIALKDFLEAMLGKEITDLTLNPNEPAVDMLQELQMSFDVSVTFNDGERACIEMQSRRENYDYAARAEIHAARLLNVNTQKGSNWHSESVYQISVLDFEFDKSDDKAAFKWYSMRSEDGKQLAKKLNVIFLDLVKIHKLLGSPIEKLSKIEKWGLFLSYADDERYVSYIKELSKNEEGLMNAQVSLGRMSQDEINWHRQNSIDTARRDYNSNMEYAIKTGLERGAHQKAVEAARNLLAMGLGTYEQIAQAEGLTLEEVQALAKKN